VDVTTKNILGGGGLIVLAVAGYLYVSHVFAAPAAKPKVEFKARHPALDADISNYNADQVIAFVRGLGKLDRISEEDRVAIFAKLKTRYDAMPGAEKLILMTAAMEAYQDNKLDPLVVNGRELMKAYQHEMLVNYYKADAEGRKKILDARLQEHKDMESLRKLQNVAGGFFGRGDDSREKRMAMMRQQIGDAIQDALKNGKPEDRAMMTQFMIEMRRRAEETGVKLPM
jgi:hypothetical protein